jgi:hypothetical protein
VNIFHLTNILPCRDHINELDGFDPYAYIKYGWMSTDPDLAIGVGSNYYFGKHWGMHIEMAFGHYAIHSGQKEFYDNMDPYPFEVQVGVNYRF